MSSLIWKMYGCPYIFPEDSLLAVADQPGAAQHHEQRRPGHRARPGQAAAQDKSFFFHGFCIFYV